MRLVLLRNYYYYYRRFFLDVLRGFSTNILHVFLVSFWVNPLKHQDRRDRKSGALTTACFVLICAGLQCDVNTNLQPVAYRKPSVPHCI
jgi:hypothetical protein